MENYQSAQALHRAVQLTYELEDEDEGEKDEKDDKDEEPVKVPKRRLSTRFSFFAVCALFLVF